MMIRIGRLLERLLMSLTGKRVDKFSVAATELGDDDYFGIAQDIGGGVYQTKKFKGAVMFKHGNLVYADAVNGSDTIGAHGRADRPFLTLTAAKTAAVTGDTIVVRPGTYTDGTINKNGVNWHFLNGAVVNAPAGEWVMNDSNFDGGTNVSFTSRVTGFGTFIGGFWVSQGASDLYVEGLAVENGGKLSCFMADGGIIRCKVVRVELIGAGSAVNVNAGTLIIEADVITCDFIAGSTVWIKGNAFIRARLIEHTNLYAAITIQATTGESFVCAELIMGGAGTDAVIFSATGGIHQIIDSKIRVPSGAGSAIAVSQNGLILRGVTLVGSGAGFSIAAGAPQTIQAWSYILGNLALNNVTITDDSAPSRFVQSASVA